MKKLLILICLAFFSISVYANVNSISLSKIQQNRLNSFINQIKLPVGEYKLTVYSTGTRLESYIQKAPQVITKVVEITNEVTKEVPVEKIITIEKVVEKIIPDPRISTGSFILSQENIDVIKNCRPGNQGRILYTRGDCLDSYFRKIGLIVFEP